MYHIKSTVSIKFGRPRQLFTCSLSIPAPLTSLKLATSKSCSGYAFFIRELPGKSPESYLTINKIIKLIYVSLVSLLFLSVRQSQGSWIWWKSSYIFCCCDLFKLKDKRVNCWNCVKNFSNFVFHNCSNGFGQSFLKQQVLENRCTCLKTFTCNLLKNLKYFPIEMNLMIFYRANLT